MAIWATCISQMNMPKVLFDQDRILALFSSYLLSKSCIFSIFITKQTRSTTKTFKNECKLHNLKQFKANSTRLCTQCLFTPPNKNCAKQSQSCPKPQHVILVYWQGANTHTWKQTQNMKNKANFKIGNIQNAST